MFGDINKQAIFLILQVNIIYCYLLLIGVSPGGHYHQKGAVARNINTIRGICIQMRFFQEREISYNVEHIEC